MSKLKNAPLLEVIFELRWNMSGPDHWKQFPFLQGDLYSRLKEEYPQRETLFPVEVPQRALENKPTFRYRSNNEYPMVQFGPGILTLNTTDDYYEWEKYSEDIKGLTENFFSVYNFASADTIAPSLSYYDFLKFDWENQDILKYINENLNIAIDQKFYDFQKEPLSFNWGIGYGTDVGIFNLRIDTGANNNQTKGLVLQFQLKANRMAPDSESLNRWLDEGHKLCSKLFKELTKGKLYDSFTQ